MFSWAVALVWGDRFSHRPGRSSGSIGGSCCLGGFEKQVWGCVLLFGVWCGRGSICFLRGSEALRVDAAHGRVLRHPLHGLAAPGLQLAFGVQIGFDMVVTLEEAACTRGVSCFNSLNAGDATWGPEELRGSRPAKHEEFDHCTRSRKSTTGANAHSLRFVPWELEVHSTQWQFYV